jgi:trafficking protein particle complex subunit 11
LEEDRPKIPAQWILHSPQSPLSPDSPLYPDGIFTPLWVAKHQNSVPSILITFYNFTSDASLNSLNDNQLKSEINGIKAGLSESGHRTRLAVVLLSDKTIIEAPDIEDRLANIRRTTGLDPKSGLFFLPPNTSKVEVTSFAMTVMNTLQPLCIDYYRDLTKHARRKKNRGNVSAPTIQPTTTSHPLSTVGWSVRYDVKMGIFAEFRQEMDVACRNYTSALESLLGSEGVFETTPSWSPRWNEGRTLSDVLAMRIIRCLLWTSMTTTAALSWVNYRDRMRELIDRRGKGTSNYGWEAWESRWAKVMAELIQKADLPSIAIGDSMDMTASMVISGKSENTTFLLPEKGLVSSDLAAPWSLLHHPGYWMRLSARNAKRRRRLALEIPADDRTPPNETPASAMAHRSSTYDLYLVQEPHLEYAAATSGTGEVGKDIVEKLSQSGRFFLERNQKRFASRLRLEAGRELLRMGQSKDAVRLLRPLWEAENCTWRTERWLFPLFNLDRVLFESAKAAGDIPLVVSTVFELYNSSMLILKDMRVDLMNCAKSLLVANAEPAQVNLSPDDVLSFSKFAELISMLIK